MYEFDLQTIIAFLGTRLVWFLKPILGPLLLLLRGTGGGSPGHWGAGSGRGKGEKREFYEGGNNLLNVKILSKTRIQIFLTYI